METGSQAPPAPTVLDYEQPRPGSAAGQVPRSRRRPPGRKWVNMGWLGGAMLIWGNACLPGGALVMFAGIFLAGLAFARIAVWEFKYRPVLRAVGFFAPSVPRRGWLLGFLLASFAGHLTGISGPAVAMILKPVWAPMADYWYGQRPMWAPEPSVIIIGPYVLLDPNVTPTGISGRAPGGGSIRLSWDETYGYWLQPRYPPRWW